MRGENGTGICWLVKMWYSELQGKFLNGRVAMNARWAH